MTDQLEFIRLRTVMCDEHRESILDTRIWPHPLWFPGNHQNPARQHCDDCSAVGAKGAPGPVYTHPALRSDVGRAYHEAGHVVVFMATGYKPVLLSLNGSGADGSDAHCIMFGASGRTLLYGSWAGQSATLEWLRREGLLDDDTRVDAALGAALDVHNMLAAHSMGETLAARDDADFAVQELWPQIERLAEALVCRWELNGEEITQIVGDVSLVLA